MATKKNRSRSGNRQGDTPQQTSKLRAVVLELYANARNNETWQQLLAEMIASGVRPTVATAACHILSRRADRDKAISTAARFLSSCGYNRQAGELLGAAQLPEPVAIDQCNKAVAADVLDAAALPDVAEDDAAAGRIDAALAEGDFKTAEQLVAQYPGWSRSPLAGAIAFNFSRQRRLRGGDADRPILETFLGRVADYSARSNLAVLPDRQIVLHVLHERASGDAGWLDSIRIHLQPGKPFFSLTLSAIGDTPQPGAGSSDHDDLIRDIEARIPFLQDYTTVSSGGFDLRDLSRLLAALRHRQAGVLHAWTLRSSLYCAIAGQIARTPKIVLTADVPPARAHAESGWDFESVAATLRQALQLPHVTFVVPSQADLRAWLAALKVTAEAIRADTRVIDLPLDRQPETRFPAAARRRLPKTRTAETALFRQFDDIYASNQLRPRRRFVIRAPNSAD